MKKITFATNTGPNTLEYTKLLLKSLKEDFTKFQNETVEVSSNNKEISDLFIQFYRNHVHFL